MRKFRTTILLIGIISLLFLQLAQPALAAPSATPSTDTPLDTAAYGIHCTAGVCTLRIKDAGVALPAPVAAGATLLLTFLQDQIQMLPEGAGLQITDDVTIQTPMGKLALFDTDMVIQLAADNTIERLRGTAQVPWPSFLGSEAVGVERALAVADIGLEPGKFLNHLNLPLVADQAYFYLRLGAGVQTDATGAPQRETLRAIDSPVTRGQYLTVLFEPQNFDLLLDGNLTIALLDDWLLLNEFLTDQTGLPFALASEAVNLHVSGLLSTDWRASYLRLDGLYTLEKQFIRNWFQTDASPLAVTGSLLINREGLLLSGLTRSSVLPDRLFDGEMWVEAFLPLASNFWNAYVATGTQATSPLWAMQHAHEQHFSAALLQPLVNSALASVEQTAATVQPLFVVVKDTATDAVVYAARGYQQTQAAASDGYAWTVETVVNSATTATALTQAGIASVQDLTTFSYRWTADLVAAGATTTADVARDAYTWTATQVTNGAATVADVTADGYRATLDLAGASYNWTATATGSAVATVAALTVDGYTTTSSGMADHVERLTTWVWPAE